MNQISVVIPCYNSAQTIEGCIKSLLNQSLKPDEIIVVDDGSKDNTVNIARKFPVTVIQTEHLGPSHARNVGVMKSRGGYIVFVESDAWYKKTYIEGMITPMIKDRTVYATKGGGREVWGSSKNLLNRFFNQRWKVAGHLRKRKERGVLGAWNFRREVFEKVGYYKEDFLCGEDVDLAQRIEKAGYKIYEVKWTKNAVMVHKEPDTLRMLIVQNFWKGFARRRYALSWEQKLTLHGKVRYGAGMLFFSTFPVWAILSLYHWFFYGLLGIWVFKYLRQIYTKEIRLMSRFALKNKDIPLVLALPGIRIVEILSFSAGTIFSWMVPLKKNIKLYKKKEVCWDENI